MKKIIAIALLSLFATACAPADATTENNQCCCKEMMGCCDKNKDADMSKCCCKGMMDGKNINGKMCGKKANSKDAIIKKMKSTAKADSSKMQSTAPQQHEQHHQ